MKRRVPSLLERVGFAPSLSVNVDARRRPPPAACGDVFLVDPVEPKRNKRGPASFAASTFRTLGDGANTLMAALIVPPSCKRRVRVHRITAWCDSAVADTDPAREVVLLYGAAVSGGTRVSIARIDGDASPGPVAEFYSAGASDGDSAAAITATAGQRVATALRPVMHTAVGERATRAMELWVPQSRPLTVDPGTALLVVVGDVPATFEFAANFEWSEA